MRTPASIVRHPIHPMLVPFPIGLWIFSFVCDLVFAFGSGNPVWKTVALYTMIGGIIGALAAAIPGLVDLLSLPRGPRTTAIVHMSLNLTVVVLFAINIWLRLSSGEVGAASSGPVWLSLIAIVLLAVSGWLGGRLVYELGVAVDTENIRGSGTSADLSRLRDHEIGHGDERDKRRDAEQRPREKEAPVSSWKR